MTNPAALSYRILCLLFLDSLAFASRQQNSGFFVLDVLVIATSNYATDVRSVLTASELAPVDLELVMKKTELLFQVSSVCQVFQDRTSSHRKGIIFWCQRKIHRCGIGDEKVCSTPTSVSSDKNCRIARSLGVFGISCWFGTRTLDYSEQEHSPLRVRHTVLFTALAPLTATIGYSINSSKSRRGWVVVT